MVSLDGLEDNLIDERCIVPGVFIEALSALILLYKKMERLPCVESLDAHSCTYSMEVHRLKCQVARPRARFMQGGTTITIAQLKVAFKIDRLSTSSVNRVASAKEAMRDKEWNGNDTQRRELPDLERRYAKYRM